MAQKLSFGIVGGTNLTDDFRTLRDPFTYLGNNYTYLSYSDSRSFIAGPTLEIGLPKWGSLEVNAVHRTLKYADMTDSPGTSAPFHASVPTWQFPLLLKYRFPISRARPFVEAGPSLRTYSNPSGSRPSHYGITGGAGVEVSAGSFHIGPSLRYTRWGSDDRPFRPTIRNQVELLVGVRYATDAGTRKLFGEKFWLGVVAGVPLTSDFPPASVDVLAYTGESTRFVNFRFVAGIMAEMGITDKLSLEANGLYRRLHFSTGPEVVVTWELPVLAKYKFSSSAFKPFVELGPSFRPTGNLNNSDPSHYGVTGGAGVEAYMRKLRVAPTVRYTRWAADNRVRVSPQQFTTLNQLELLVGVSF